MSTIIPEQTVVLDQFRCNDDQLHFEADGDLTMHLRGFESGVFDAGAVLVLLDVDGGGMDIVKVAQQFGSVAQLDAAMAAMQDAKKVLELAEAITAACGGLQVSES